MVSRGKLTQKDIDRVGYLSIFEQSCFSFERMQAPGFCWGMVDAFKKIYPNNPEEVSRAMHDNLEFMNTEPHFASFLQGLVISMEESGQDPELIRGVKNGLFGPLAGLGDSIFWYTLMPLTASICCSLASSGSVLGPILFILIWIVGGLSRVWFTRWGYKLGVGAVKLIGEQSAYLTKAAGILGVTVVGGLIPSYVTFAFADTLVVGTVSIQGIFDSVMPNILPLGFVLFLYWLFKKKNINTIKLIFIVIVASCIFSILGIM
jgi:galactosamine PTS system EIID component